ANIPKRHSGAANSAMEARYGGASTITMTLDATMTQPIDQVTPCGAANQPHGHSQTNYGDSVTEPIVLAPGQGITLVASAAGSTAQLVRLSAVWSEQASAPTAQSQYTYSAGPIAASTTVATYAYAAFMNPA